MDPECSVMEGRLTLYVVDKSYESEMTQLAREYIKAMMNDGLLDNASPAILGVSFIDDRVRGFVDRDIILNEDDDLEDPDSTIFAVGQNMWIAIGSSLFGVAVIGSVLRYRYSSQFDDHGDRIDDSGVSENYSEFRPVTPQNDIETSRVFDDSTGISETEVETGLSKRYRLSSHFDNHRDRIDDNDMSKNDSELNSATPQNDIETSRVLDDSKGILESEIETDGNPVETMPTIAQIDTETAQMFMGNESIRTETVVEADDNPNRVEFETEVDRSLDDILPAVPTSLLNDNEGSLIFDVFDIIDANADRIVVEDEDESLEAASYSC